jgi:hypothetical protein
MLFVSTGLLNSQTPLLLRSSLGIGGASVTVTADGSKNAFPQSIGQYGIAGVFNKQNLEIRQGFIQPVLIIKPFRESENIKISVYPNPFSSVVYVKLTSEITGSIELKITDLAGKPVYVEKRQADELIQVDLSSLCRGIYLLNVRNNNIQINCKIIKN